MSTEGGMTGQEDPRDALERYRGVVATTLAVAVLGYLAYAVWQGLSETASELGAFRWSLYVPVLCLTLVNYGLRYAKWRFLLRRLGVRMPEVGNLWAFAAGLGMVISPGKAGELVKPYLVREMTGVPMTRTVPALVVERATDGLAVVLLAAFGVSSFYPEQTPLILGTLAGCFVAILVASVEAPARAVLRGLARLPVVGRLAPRLDEAYASLRTCIGPWPLLFTLGTSVVAWFAECVGYWLVFVGLGVACDLERATFLYAFATVFGAPSPGGMGMADAALVEGARHLVPGLGNGAAMAAALLVRIATLWFGVVLGAIALLRIDAVIARTRAAA